MEKELKQYLGKKFEKINIELLNIKEDLRGARKERQIIEKRINDTYTAVDGFIKVVDKLDQEFVLMKEEIRRIKTIIKEKLGVDLS